MEEIKILVINPGSTSTKIAVYHNTSAIFIKNINHTLNELSNFKSISDQYEYRKDLILKELEMAQVDLKQIHIVIGRGGIIKPIESGVYEVNEVLKQDLKASILGEHASNLGGLIADEIACSLKNVKAYIADPVVVDEMIDVAHVSGHPDFKRLSIFHA